MYLERKITSFLERIVHQFPAILLSGCRQSGKSTLLRKIFPDYAYVTLDDIQARDTAKTDPKLFLDFYKAPVIIDEIQNAPDLLSYIKIEIDNNRKKKGQYILTGSQQFNLVADIHESLAGRLGMATLTPMSIEELKKKNISTWITHSLSGLYPELITDKELEPKLWYSTYIESLLNKDIRDNLKREHLGTYDRFIKLIAARCGQELKYQDFAKELGVSNLTIQSWINLLERSQIIFLIQPYYNNLGKRIVKSPKLYFLDTGLVSYLSGNSNQEIIQNGPMGGALFENFVIAEIFKFFSNRGIKPPLYHFRDSQGVEVDLVIEYENKYLLFEIKSTMSPKKNHISGLSKVSKLFTKTTSYLVCNTKEQAPLNNEAIAVNWLEIFSILESFISSDF
ncbi:MAG: ATP-binding protein [Candidatus Caenarcaniphilales bacterium]|nr:ATP-binding protein [Candidatus Caenarcaniphilales bacterium]